jgi:hypothetical protein
MRRRCPTPDCGAKVHPRASYCSQVCRDAHKAGRTRAAQLKLEAEERSWTWEFNRRAVAEALLCLAAD